jgi:hypothetical protein
MCRITNIWNISYSEDVFQEKRDLTGQSLSKWTDKCEQLPGLLFARLHINKLLFNMFTTTLTKQMTKRGSQHIFRGFYEI